jgi:hypothetical protein
MRNYGETGDAKYLGMAVNEVKNRSNPDHEPGIQNRRDGEAYLLNDCKDLGQLAAPPPGAGKTTDNIKR